MFFRRSKPAPLAEAAHMGFRSKLVLAKLGFDLREQYGDLPVELPDEMRAWAERLEGEDSVIPYRQDRRRR
jgi:hypothetical protein